MLLQNLRRALKDAEDKQKQGLRFSRSSAYFFLLECSKHEDLDCCRLLRALMVASKLDSIPVLADHLIRLFASCGSLNEANQVFENVVTPSKHTWCAIIAAHTKLGHHATSFELYDKMTASGLESNKVLYLTILKSCINGMALIQGRQVHHQIIKSGIQSDVMLVNSIIDMYAKCGSLDEAIKVFKAFQSRNVVSWNTIFAGCVRQGDFRNVVHFFELMQEEGIKPNIVSWGALIEGYAEHGDGLLALDSFDKMQGHGIKPDRVIFLSILKACGSMGALNHGRHIHNLIVRMNSEDHDGVGNALIDMYSKCGSLAEAHRVLRRLCNRDVVSWNTIITAYAQCGQAMDALWSFQCMQAEGIKPDDVTFINILSSCCHAGLIDELKCHFMSMHVDYGIEPDIKHYSCMLDLFGQMGFLNEASNLRGSIQSDAISRISILTACQKHGNVELGGSCFIEDTIAKYKR
ncbi:hypothetical protein KP509_34G057700 [Ceratopteris richardii]|uniref:Pentatricopeptide repeat-containing protein n=1 Tax=Ceratopteris richardii TaxID=49495 RepID=A0A8T2QLH7_CERRI|nr:hypothetical protein KP509_34G057700 [Ceratopteris richardii]